MNIEIMKEYRCKCREFLNNILDDCKPTNDDDKFIHIKSEFMLSGEYYFRYDEIYKILYYSDLYILKPMMEFNEPVIYNELIKDVIIERFGWEINRII